MTPAKSSANTRPRPQLLAQPTQTTWPMAKANMNDDATQILTMTRLITAVELRGFEPLTSSMPWWPVKRRRRSVSVDRVLRRVGAATSGQPRSPSVCPPSFEPRPSRLEPRFSGWEAGAPANQVVLSGSERGRLVKKFCFVGTEQPLCCFGRFT